MRVKHHRVTVTLCQTKLKSGKISYFVRYLDCGTQPKITLKGMNKHDAKEFAHQLELKLNQPEVIVARKSGITYEQYKQKTVETEESKRVAIALFMDEHLGIVKASNAHNTWVNYAIAYKQFKAFLSEKELVFLDQVSYSVLEAYKGLLQTKYKPSSVAGKLNSLIGLFEFGRKRGFIAESPFLEMEQIDIPEREIKTFTDAEIAKLLEVVKDDRPGLYTMLLVAFDTAARFNELTSIVRKCDFKFEKDENGMEYGMMSITNHSVRTKNKKNRYTPIRPKTVKALKQFLEPLNDNDLVFNNVDRSKGKWFKEYVIKANLDPSYHFHMIRKTALTKLANSGIDIMRLCDIAGHSSIEVSRKYYLKRSAEETARAIAKLPL